MAWRLKTKSGTEPDGNQYNLDSLRFKSLGYRKLPRWNFFEH